MRSSLLRLWWWSSGVAGDEPGRRGGENGPAAAVHALAQEPGVRRPHVTARLVDAGQVDRRDGGDRGVVVADEGKVLRDAQPELVRGPQHPHRGDVGPGEDGGRPAGPAEKLAPGAIP